MFGAIYAERCAVASLLIYMMLLTPRCRRIQCSCTHACCTWLESYMVNKCFFFFFSFETGSLFVAYIDMELIPLAWAWVLALQTYTTLVTCWWRVILGPALRGGGRRISWVWPEPALQSEFQDCQGYHPEKTKQTKRSCTTTPGCKVVLFL